MKLPIFCNQIFQKPFSKLNFQIKSSIFISYSFFNIRQINSAVFESIFQFKHLTFFKLTFIFKYSMSDHLISFLSHFLVNMQSCLSLYITPLYHRIFITLFLHFLHSLKYTCLKRVKVLFEKFILYFFLRC